MIVVSSGHLVTIDSDELDDVQIKVTMTDGHGLNSEPLIMNWNYVRQGRIVDDSQGTAIIPVEFQSVRSNLYSAVIDMNTSSDLQKGDYLMVWFEVQMPQAVRLLLEPVMLNRLRQLFVG